MNRIPTGRSAAVCVLVCLSYLGTFTMSPHARADDRAYPDPPDWVGDKVCYQVNLRQFSEQGGLAGFREHLPRLKELGVGVLWFMPIHPIGVEARSGTLGSPYAVRDFTAFSPEFGTIDEFKHVVDEAHGLGMHVILDWVANHTAPDHPWVQQHPDWYTRDAQGQLVAPIPEWADVVELNFDAMPMRDAMIEAMEFWVRETDIDGFRCDTAEWQPLDFWETARDRLRTIKPVFMLAEGAKPELIDYAFDATYGWDFAVILEGIAKQERPVNDLREYIAKEAEIVQGSAFRLNYTTNHDINAWQGTIAERLGAAADAAAVLAFTLPGMPLIHTGQEVGLDRRLPFFEHAPVAWKESPNSRFFQSLGELKRALPPLHHGQADAPVRMLETKADSPVILFRRERGGHAVTVAVNLSPEPQVVHGVSESGKVKPPSHGYAFGRDGTLRLDPWGFVICHASTPAGRR